MATMRHDDSRSGVNHETAHDNVPLVCNYDVDVLDNLDTLERVTDHDNESMREGLTVLDMKHCHNCSGSITTDTGAEKLR